LNKEISDRSADLEQRLDSLIDLDIFVNLLKEFALDGELRVELVDKYTYAPSGSFLTLQQSLKYKLLTEKEIIQVFQLAAFKLNLLSFTQVDIEDVCYSAVILWDLGFFEKLATQVDDKNLPCRKDQGKPPRKRQPVSRGYPTSQAARIECVYRSTRSKRLVVC
jgi:hypothetical protein